MKGATASATRDFAARFTTRGYSRDAYRPLGKTGLSVCALGFGAYRVDDETPEHRQALEKALGEGCNLIDTSTNYTDGASETCIGGVIEKMIRARGILREELVVVSKIGYVQGRNLDLARDREENGESFPEMVKISDWCWHCIHPEFLRDQLDRSLSRLKLERLDVCLLHNPEYYLEENHRSSPEADLETFREGFYDRIRAAFAHFELEVQRGRIAWYGVSSNSFGSPPDRPESTSLDRMLEAAREAARETGLSADGHHFAVAQLPLNLYEHGPIRVKKEGAGGSRPAVAFAAENDVGVLVNRPLNAFARGELLRLADFQTGPPPVPIQQALNRVSTLEEEFLREIGSSLPASSGGVRAEALFAWGKRLTGVVGRLGDYEHWRSIQEQQIHSHLSQTISALRSGLPPELSQQFQGWLGRYLPEMGNLLDAFRAECAGKSQLRSDRIASALNPFLPRELRSETLSRKALHSVASLDGVSCVLNGMRHSRYVEDSMGILKWDRLPAAVELFGKL